MAESATPDIALFMDAASFAAERPRSQALFSGVWGVASVAGPIVGGYITDALSWRWVFYINIPFGLLCTAVIAAAYPASKVLRTVKVDWTGAALLFLGVSALLVASVCTSSSRSLSLAKPKSRS